MKKQPPSISKSARRDFRSAFLGAESARNPDDKAYDQNQTKPAAADGRTAHIKPTAA
jgi:hypothetical protein